MYNLGATPNLRSATPLPLQRNLLDRLAYDLESFVELTSRNGQLRQEAYHVVVVARLLRREAVLVRDPAGACPVPSLAGAQLRRASTNSRATMAPRHERPRPGDSALATPGISPAPARRSAAPGQGHHRARAQRSPQGRGAGDRIAAEGSAGTAHLRHGQSSRGAAGRPRGTSRSAGDPARSRRLDGEHSSRAAEPYPDLVGAQDAAEAVGDLPEAQQEGRRLRDETALALDRLDDAGRDPIGTGFPPPRCDGCSPGSSKRPAPRWRSPNGRGSRRGDGRPPARTG